MLRRMNQPHRQAPERHTVFDDTQGIFTGTLFVSLALLMFNQAGLLTGGTADLAFVLHYATGVSFGRAWPASKYQWKLTVVARMITTVIWLPDQIPDPKTAA